MFNDVLVFAYAQTWGEKTVGARYWMAKGVGPVAIEWIGYQNEQVIYTSPRIDAKISKFY